MRLLTEYFPVSDENSRKPILFHDIRVGVYLYNQGYAEDIVLAGLLHDAIEWSDITAEMIREKFGPEVLRLILASTKDETIEDKKERNKEHIMRCISEGENALIIKAADIIDSFIFYEVDNNQDQLHNHCVKNAKMILKNKPSEFQDKIFKELKKWHDRYLEK